MAFSVLASGRPRPHFYFLPSGSLLASFIPAPVLLSMTSDKKEKKNLGFGRNLESKGERVKEH